MKYFTNIKDLIPLIGTGKIIQFKIPNDEGWLDATIIGIDLEDKKVKVKGFGTLWRTFSFQLNARNPIFYHFRHK
jgi:hypothetical protein